MSGNRRYDLIGPTVDRVAAEDARRGCPQGLTPEKVRRTGRRRDLEAPASVSALVQFRFEHIEAREVAGGVVATTPGGPVLVRWTDARGHVSHVWVWGNAVRAR